MCQLFKPPGLWSPVMAAQVTNMFLPEGLGQTGSFNKWGLTPSPGTGFMAANMTVFPAGVGQPSHNTSSW